MKNCYTYRSLGLNGRFGNQMFQYATLFSLASSKGAPFFIPDSVNRSDFKLEGEYELLEAFSNLSAGIRPVSDPVFTLDKQYVEQSFCYDPNLSLICGDVDLHGYFQSEMYFKNHRDQIKKEFSFSEAVVSRCSQFMSELRTRFPGSNICSLHVRRGDYQGKSEYHTMLSSDTNYYQTCIQGILHKFPNTTFVIFSDDVEWCKASFPSQAIFPEMRSQYEDMCLMTMCDTHIIANSSFSWWGAWLSDSNLVIAPRAWFGPKGPPDWSSIYCAGWNVA